ncbi:DUF3833 domain-containing protein [Leucothrix sargassi]|nr:DUF3833 domain-containing protein [Leucothrix sargassi]
MTLSALGLSSCSTTQINELPNTDTELKIEEYFLGKSKAYGILFDRSGVPQRNFLVDLVGEWDEKTQTLTLNEDFVFDDGEESFRQWKIKKLPGNKYTGEAADVIGTAQGESKGNAFNLKYVLEVPYKGSTIALKIDDWMYLGEDNILINRAGMYKFGFKVGEIFISFKK